MEIHQNKFREHAKDVSQILAEVCVIPAGGSLVSMSDEAGTRVIGVAVSGAVPHQQHREVTSDLGRRETVLGFPIPTPGRPRYWIGVHEIWRPTKKRLSFVSCGLRLYMGFAEEQLAQVLRLEWVAPEKDTEGKIRYDGGHAGHPHWHIDRSALVGDEEYRRTLAVLTTSGREVPLENFEPERSTAETALLGRQVQDCSWLQDVHLPAQAGWMHRAWDGAELPAPHQSSPNDLISLSSWWRGAMRYVAAELHSHTT